jgi:hypothetical protein
MQPRWICLLLALGAACDPVDSTDKTDVSDAPTDVSDETTDTTDDATDPTDDTPTDDPSDVVTDQEPTDIAVTDSDVSKSDITGDTGNTDVPHTGAGWGSDTYDAPSDSDALNPCPNSWENQDCDGECWPKSWVGDGFCDDGTLKPWGDANFMCASFQSDLGDCDVAQTDVSLTDADTGGSDAGTDPSTDWNWLTDEPNDTSGNTPDSGGIVDSDPCPPDAVLDCDGECASPQWVGDGFCDDGAERAWGSPDLNCEDFGFDGGDCSTDPAPIDTDISPTDSGGCGIGFLADCDDACWPASWLGDGRCDDGTEQEWGSPDFDCRAFEQDAGDCSGRN